MLDEIQTQMFQNKEFRIWQNGHTSVLLPSPNNDVVFVFTHILQHFYKSGIGLRQICDWSRLLYKYYDEIDEDLLKNRLRKMGILSEWKVFGSFIVRYLGVPKEKVPMFSQSSSRKVDRLSSYILEKGNFGQNVDRSYLEESTSLFRRKLLSLNILLNNLRLQFAVFPINSIRFGFKNILNGIDSITGDD